MPKAGTKAKTEGQEASAAAASPAAKRTAPKPARSEGAPSAGEIANDEALSAEIFRELGADPARARSDTAAAVAEADEAGDTEAAAAAAEDEGEEVDESLADEAADTEGETEEREARSEEREEGSEAEGEESEGEPAEEAGEADEEAQADELPAGLKRELTKLREERRQLRDRVQKLEEQTQAHGAAPRPMVKMELEVMQANSDQALAALEERYQSIEDECIANRDGLELPADKEGAEPRTLDRAQVGKVLADARKALRMIPQRRQFLAQERECVRIANEKFVEFQDPDSQESQAANYILRIVPELRRIPNWKTLVGDCIVGERVRVAKEKAAKTAGKGGQEGRSLPGKPVQAVRKPPAAVPGAPVRAASAPPAKTARLKAASERAGRTGSEDDIARFIEASLAPA